MSSSRAGSRAPTTSSPIGRARQALLVRQLGEAVLQGLQRAEVEVGVAPLQDAQRLEAVVLQGLDQSRDRRRSQRPVVPKVPSRRWRPGAARDLAELGRRTACGSGSRRISGRPRRRRGRRRGSGPCRSRRSRRGNRRRRTGRARPGRCGCAARARRAPPPRRRAGAGSARRSRRPPRPRTRRWPCAAAGGEIFFSPAKVRFERRGRVTTCDARDQRLDQRPHGRASRSAGSPRGRAGCRRRSVKTWPRSRSAASWISSMATKATSRSRGIASTVQIQ